MQLSSIVLYTLMGAGTSAQLVPVSVPEDLSTNFKLRAIVDRADRHRDGAKVIHNWLVGVAGGPNRCYKELVLQKPAEHDGTTFWFESERQLIHSAQFFNTSFSFGMRDAMGTKQVALACGYETSHIGVGIDGKVPILQHALDGVTASGRWVVCNRTGLFDLYYQEEGSTELIASHQCVPVKLFSECAEGDEHGLSDVSVCCKTTHDGICGMPPHNNRPAEGKPAKKDDPTKKDTAVVTEKVDADDC